MLTKYNKAHRKLIAITMDSICQILKTEDYLLYVPLPILNGLRFPSFPLTTPSIMHYLLLLPSWALVNEILRTQWLPIYEI